MGLLLARMSTGLALAEGSPSGQTPAQIAPGGSHETIELVGRSSRPRAVFRHAGFRPERGQGGAAHLQHEPDDRPDRRLASTHSLPLHARRRWPAGSLHRLHHAHRPRCRIQVRWHHGMGRVRADIRASPWRAPGELRGSERGCLIRSRRGAKLLVGGSHRTISLQPLALQGQTGVNLALGVAGLRLR